MRSHADADPALHAIWPTSPRLGGYRSNCLHAPFPGIRPIAPILPRECYGGLDVCVQPLPRVYRDTAQMLGPQAGAMGLGRCTAYVTAPSSASAVPHVQYGQKERSCLRVLATQPATQPGFRSCLGGLHNVHCTLRRSYAACSHGDRFGDLGPSSSGQQQPDSRSSQTPGQHSNGLGAFISNSCRVAGSVALLCLAAMGSPRTASAAELRCVCLSLPTGPGLSSHLSPYLTSCSRRNSSLWQQAACLAGWLYLACGT